MQTVQAHIDALIAAYLSGGLDKAAMDELADWIAESEENEHYFMQRQELWFSAVQKEDLDFYDYQKAFEQFQKRINRQHSLGIRHRWIIGGWKYVAAILILSVFSYFFYWQGEHRFRGEMAQMEVETPFGSQTRLRLPDGTWVVLNVGSRIVYAQDFGLEAREVELEGEGYFDVAHNADIPFFVRSRALKVQVLGTKFNFKDYPEDNEATVALLEGKVKLDNCMQPGKSIMLAPCEKVVLDKVEGVMRLKSQSDVCTDLQWQDGDLNFHDMVLSEAVKMLERSYDVKINVENEKMKDLRFHGTFNRNRQSIRDILDALSATGKIHYTLKDREVLLY